MCSLLSVLFFIYLICLSSAELRCDFTNNSAMGIFKVLTNDSHYKKWEMPLSADGGPMIIKIKMYIFHLNAKETAKLDIKMQVMLELSWTDPRLVYQNISTHFGSISGGKFLLDSIWLPRVIFTNEKDSQKTGTSKKDDFVTILPSGLVLLTTRLRTSMVCLLHLGKFPFDQQNCHLNLDSLSYNSSRLQLVWDEDTPLLIDGLTNSLMEFDVLSLKNKTSNDGVSEHTTQRFSSLVIEIRLGRHYGYYLLNYYLPSMLLVIISWFSFWLHPAAVPARVTLGVSTMLTFIQLDMTGDAVPRASQFMANDIWAVVCTAFIFLSLAEFAFVNSIERKKGVDKVELKKLSSKHILRGGVNTAAGRARLRRSSSCPSSPEIRRHFSKTSNANAAKTFTELKEASISLGNILLASNGSNTRQTLKVVEPRSSVFTMTPQEIAIWIDAKSRIVFPLAFITFNCIYWIPLIIA